MRRMRGQFFSPLKLQTLQILTAKFNTYLKVAGNFIEWSDRWRSGLQSWWHAGGGCFEPMYGSLFFVGNPVNKWKKKFTAKNRKSYKSSPHSALKDVGALRWKFFFTTIHRSSYITFWQNLGMGISLFLKCLFFQLFYILYCVDMLTTFETGCIWLDRMKLARHVWTTKTICKAANQNKNLKF